MYSSRKATIIFVAILLLFLLSFVSAELNKRDPQAGGAGGGGGGAPPAGGDGGGGGAAGGGNQPPAAGGGGDAAPPAGGAKGGNQPPAAGGGGGNAAPQAGGAGGGNQPPAAGGGGGAAAPPAAGGGGGNNPSPAGNPPGPIGGGGGNNPSPAGNPPGPAGGGGGNNPSPAGNPPGPAGAGGGNSTGANPTTYGDPTVPLQVQMIEPKSAKNIIYKIGTNITFKWNYSNNGSFADPPKLIVVQAELVQDSKTKTFYPIQNLTLVTNSTQVAFWNTAAEQSLPMSEYKLWISDQDGPNGQPKPGGLLTFSGLQFGLYSSQDTGTFCDACSNAISIPMISLSSIIGVALVTVASLNLISI